MADPPSPAAAEAAAQRRRWLTIGEVVGVAALVISGLSFWDSHRERERIEADRASAERQAVTRTAFLLTATGAGAELRLAPAHAGHTIQRQTLTFPTAVRAEPVETTGNARVEAGWIGRGLRKAERHAPDAGDERVPVGVETVYLTDGREVSDRSIYDVGFERRERFLQGDAIDLTGLSLVRRGAGDLRAAVDARWAASTPKK